MILPPPSDRLRAGHPPPPWHSVPVEQAVFCTLWATGPDTTLDGILRLQAIRPTGSLASFEVFDRWCRPFDERTESATAAERIARDFGVALADLAAALHASEVWRELEEFLGDRPIVVLDCGTFAAWRAHYGERSRERGAERSRAGGAEISREGEAERSRERGAASTSLGPSIGLCEMAGLLFPGRLAQRREALVSALCVRESARSAHAVSPLDLHAALAELVRRFLNQPEDVLRVCVSGYARAWRGLSAAEPEASERLMHALALVDRPSAWIRGEVPSSALSDGRLTLCFDRELPLEDLLETLPPLCARENERWARFENVPPDREEPMPFDPADRVMLEDLFRAHLPALFAAEHGSLSYRAGQHDVARAVAETLGSGELLLVHAPTGTGKTLAYLVPAMLWARRYDVRIGIATYTRALQEQAMDREVPRALAALARAGIAVGVRVSVLKGRDNYLCWRALKICIPGEDDGGESWLAWTMLALFGQSDVDGDLDRMPHSSPLPLGDTSSFSSAMQGLMRQVRAQTACCTHRDDRETCAAEIARRRAEKSHVVISNQAFVLARQEFFKHLVFDECEHLHDQAHSAWSHTLSLRSIRGVLSRLHHAGRTGRNRALLDRLKGMVLEGTPSHETITRSIESAREVREDLDRLEREIERFMAWRTERARERNERDDHSLLREFVEAADIVGEDGSSPAADLVESRRAFTQHGNELDSNLAELAERLDTMPLRGMPRLRRSLELVRQDLLEILAAVEAWIPLDEGRPSFRPRTFYDVERDVRGDTVLASRVLLPNEFLGRNYYPSLSTGVFLSATTWLQESFEPARGYLGLDRAAEPDRDEDRPPCVVKTFRAPDVFDYARVLVAVPRDAPAIANGKDEFLEYVRRFVAHLAERTRGRLLVLFTNAQDTVRIGEELEGFFRARRIPLWFQNMEGTAKEEISELFRSRVDSVLLGVDTFWYGADFPGETLEYLVIVKLPYGVPDRYHHAQCAALGAGEQRRRIYLPRALAKFRQGFGRLMRRESDKGCVFLLDGRVLEPRHRFFLKELPIGPSLARLVRGDTDRCVHEALEHMGLVADVQRRGLDWSFETSATPGRRPSPIGTDGGLDEIVPRSSSGSSTASNAVSNPVSKDGSSTDPDAVAPAPRSFRRPRDEPLDIPVEDLPF